MSYLAKPLAFPKVKTFQGLFDKAEPYTATPGSSAVERGAPKHGTMIITRYLSISTLRGGHHSLLVTPNAKVIDFIRKNMLMIDYDRLYFEIVMRSRAEALVLVKHNKIIGSRWLAMINPRTIPAA